MLFAALALLLLAACTQAAPTPLSTTGIAVPQLSDALERMELVRPAVEQVQSAIVAIVVEYENRDAGSTTGGDNNRGSGYGSGVIFDRQGLILTNNQLVQDASQVTVILLDGTELQAAIVGADSLSGLAVLRVPGEDNPFLPLASDAEVLVGDVVVAVGSNSTAPMGSTVVSAGVVSFLGRPLNVAPQIALYDLIQTDIISNPNHNGAALVSLTGELVGIIVQTIDGPTHISFAVGMKTATLVALQLVELGRVRHPYLGVIFSSQVVSVSEFGGELPRAVIRTSPEKPEVVAMDDDGPAKLAGVKPGDIIVSLDSHEVASTEDVRSLLRQEFKVGQDIEVVVTRDGESQTFRLVLGERPTPGSLSTKSSTSKCNTISGAKVETGRQATPLPTLAVDIPTLQNEYTSQQLGRWRKEAEDAVWPLGVGWSSWVDVGRNRIAFTTYTSYGAEKAREAIAETTVPIDAVVFDVDPKQQLDEPPIQIDTPNGIRISLEFEPSAPVGQPVLFEVVLTNRGDGAAEIEHGDPAEDNVLVFTSDGDQIWTKLRGIFIGVGGSTRLEPGEQIRLQTIWEQRDMDGFALPPGCYLVRGSIRFLESGNGLRSILLLATKPHELVIQP